VIKELVLSARFNPARVAVLIFEIGIQNLGQFWKQRIFSEVADLVQQQDLLCPRVAVIINSSPFGSFAA